MLVESGDLESISIRAIADRVGVTPPAIYLHFADKTELVFAICEAHFARLDDVMERAGADPLNPLESLRARGLAYIQFGLANPVHYRILLQSKDTPAGYAAKQLSEQAAFRHLVDAVQRCLDAGIFPPGDPQRLGFALWAAAHGVVSLVLAAPESPWGPPEELAELAIEMAGMGLAVGGSLLPLPAGFSKHGKANPPTIPPPVNPPVSRSVNPAAIRSVNRPADPPADLGE